MKRTKKALLTSFISLLICFTMLMGTTFAWFTDTASVKVTRIQSGILKVGLDVMSVTAGEPTGTWVDYSNDSTDPAAQKAIWTADDLWEPGYTSYKFVKITNEGNLALEFAIDLISKDSVVNAVTGEHLHEALEVYYTVVGEVASVERETYKSWTSAGKLSDLLTPDTDGVIHGVILPNDTKDANVTVAIAIHMMEGAGNEFQTLKEEFDLNLWAKQYTEEKDSFDNQYDADAKYGSEDTDGNFTEREDPSVPDAPVEPQPPVVTVDKAALEAAIAAAKAEAAKTDVYTADSIAAYKNAIAAAEAALETAAADDDVKAAVAALEAAKSVLVNKPTTANVTVDVKVNGNSMAGYPKTEVGAIGQPFTYNVPEDMSYYTTSDSNTLDAVNENAALNNLTINYTQVKADVTVKVLLDGTEAYSDTVEALTIGEAYAFDIDAANLNVDLNLYQADAANNATITVAESGNEIVLNYYALTFLETADNSIVWGGAGPFLAKVEQLVRSDTASGYGALEATNDNQYLVFTVEANPNGTANMGVLKVSSADFWVTEPTFEIIPGIEGKTGTYTIRISVPEFYKLLSDGGLTPTHTMIREGTGIAKLIKVDLYEYVTGTANP